MNVCRTSHATIAYDAGTDCPVCDAIEQRDRTIHELGDTLGKLRVDMNRLQAAKPYPERCVLGEGYPKKMDDGHVGLWAKSKNSTKVVILQWPTGFRGTELPPYRLVLERVPDAKG